MLSKIKNNLILIASMLALAAPAVVPAVAASALDTGSCDTNITRGIAGGANAAADTHIGCGTQNVDNGSIAKIASDVVTIFSIVVGGVAIIMIIYGGFRYITSGGSSERVGSAKNTLIYAIIGLIIVALAQVLVHFVLNQSTNITSGQSPT